VPVRGAILYIHPFAEELNHSRRMASLQARRFAALGFAVLQIDLFGCGDSCGDFGAARWDQWLRDLDIAAQWLSERANGQAMQLWGLRMGALLALDFARTRPIDGLILWQPILNGHTAINQFLRQRLTSDLRRGLPLLERNAAALRARMEAHGVIEINGYDLAAPLARAIDACDARSMTLPPCTVHWFNSATPAPAGLAPGAARLAARWAASGSRVHIHPVNGIAFWNRPELPECPALLDATSAAFCPGTS
jgi:exosortase A-associated hydrolase 2